MVVVEAEGVFVAIAAANAIFVGKAIFAVFGVVVVVPDMPDTFSILR